MSWSSNLIFSLLRPIWRLTRGMTLGAQGVIINNEGKVLLVRHGYRPGWHFPGGGVEWNETLEQALARELYEETEVEITGSVQLHAIYSNFKKFKGDHICLYIIKEWQQKKLPAPNAEIKEIGFFSPDTLPEGTVNPVRRRCEEIFNNADIEKEW
jgi:ADP-ribose pyrophosphatase YjhB (NUDIX family)